MPRYKVRYTETQVYSVYVEANSKDEAEENFYADKNITWDSYLESTDDPKIYDVVLVEEK